MKKNLLLFFCPSLDLKNTIQIFWHLATLTGTQTLPEMHNHVRMSLSVSSPPIKYNNFVSGVGSWNFSPLQVAAESSFSPAGCVEE